MANLGEVASAAVKHKVIGNCWNWLHDNFHKLTEANKIKIVLTICGKDIPQEIKGEGLAQRVVQVVYTSSTNKAIAVPGEIPAVAEKVSSTN